MASVLRFGLIAVATATDAPAEAPQSLSRNQTQYSREYGAHNVSAEDHIADRYIHEYSDKYRAQYPHDGNRTAEEQEQIAQEYRQKYADQYIQQYRDQYQHEGNRSSEEQERISQEYRHRYADQYINQYAGQYQHYQANHSENLTNEERHQLAQHYIDTYAGQYAHYTRHDDDSANRTEGSEYRQDWQQYVPADVRHYVHVNSTQNNSAVMLASKDGQGGDYSKYYAQYMGGQGSGSNPAPTLMAAQGGQGGDYSHYYSQYMQQGGSHGAGGQDGQSQGGNYSHYYSQYMQGGQGQGAQGQGGDYSHYYSKYMQQGGAHGQGQSGGYSQYMQQHSGTQSHVQNKSGTGFQRYLDRYLPLGDGKYTDSFTSKYSDQTASQESTGSTGPHGYDSYVDRYSAMAGAHPSSGSNWQSQASSQQSAYQQAVGSQISGARTGFLSGSESPTAPVGDQAAAPSRVEAPATAASVSLAASSPRSEPEATRWSSLQLVACVVAGFSLPAALAFVSTLRKTSRSSTDFEDAGFQRLIEV